MHKYRKALVLSLGLLLILSVLAVPYRGRIKQKLRLAINLVRIGNIKEKCQECSEIFDDKVSTHEQAYISEGIAPQEADQDLQVLFTRGTLVEVRSSKLYTVRELRFSKPYLLPSALTFIDTLANVYYTKCQAGSLEYVPFTITSATRSVESVKSLMGSNPNSIRNSAHLKGKTFDISYTAFKGNQHQVKLFISSLDQLRQEGKCYVKFEKNGTLHITVI